MNNLIHTIIDSAADRGSRVALRYKRNTDWEETSYAQLAQKVKTLACALIEQGVKRGDRIGLYSPNLPEWIIADFATQYIQAVSVPIYATSTAEQAKVIIDNSEMRYIFTGFADQFDNACQVIDECPKLEKIVTMDPDQNLPGDYCLRMEDLLASEASESAQQEMLKRKEAALSDDLATIIYTSGTTGVPKGVMLSHGNFKNQHSSLDKRFKVTCKDVSICFLPLSHVYERTWTAYVLLTGALSNILSNPRDVVTALAECRPTVMVSAPRLYEKVYAAIVAKVDAAPPIRRKLFYWATDVGEKYWRKVSHFETPGLGLKIKYGLADRLVLTKVRNVIGGPKNFFSSGGAPLAKDVEEFFLKLGLLVCQGYGLTETAPMLTCNAPGAYKFGTVGKPIDDVEIRIAETGEIQVRGPNVFSGYFNQPAATAEAFENGWFCTGDIGHIDDDGYIVITDRIKDIIVTSGGKNVAPQRIEALVGKDYYIDQMAIVGDKRKFLSAIVVPSFDALSEFAASQKLKFRDHEELIKMPAVVELYRNRIRQQSASLASFEQIRRFTLVAEQFSMQAGEITPTLKVKRQVIAKKYRVLIERMYAAADRD